MEQDMWLHALNERMQKLSQNIKVKKKVNESRSRA